jgi:hypothetical protein
MVSAAYSVIGGIMTRRVKTKTMLAGTMVSAFLCLSTLAASASPFPVNASASFTTGAGTIDVILRNLQPNPTDISQAICDLTFSISSSTAGATLASSSSSQLTVNTGGTFTLGGTVATGWSLVIIDPSTVELVDLASTHLILGPAGGLTYSNANSSIAGNVSNNPFLDQIATFTIADSNVTAGTTITSATFSFGLETPLPTALPLFATGIGAIGLLGWRRKRKAAY